MLRIFKLIPWLLAILAGGAAAQSLPFHDLRVSLDPQQASLTAEDRITLPEPVSTLQFALHQGLKIDSLDGDLKVKEGEVDSLERRIYRISASQPFDEIGLRYSGTLSHGVTKLSEGYAGGRFASRGYIAPEGIFLSGSSGWYPHLEEDQRLTFRLKAELPEGWHAISQGSSLIPNSWKEKNPQEEIYLVAGPFTLYQEEAEGIQNQVWLRTPDQPLANRYLQATGQYLKLYQELIGDYPYAKFALVENHWQSGYGMPSFTLLGNRVIRLPFILHTSYPHEVLHNWWGNGVYIDPSQGNWAEGLTTYLADHLLAERAGQGADYRRDALQRYADFVDQQQEYPLSEFRGNHGEVSQAIGYSKAMMLFHMLRTHVGEETFYLALRLFYKEYLHRPANWGDLRQILERASGQDLQPEFSQWLDRSGAPQLAIEAELLQAGIDHLVIAGTITQTQPGEPYQIQIPILLVHAEGQEPRLEWVVMDKREQGFRIELEQPVRQLIVDPDFDLFRRLDPGEMPLSFSKLFGAENPRILLPAAAAPERLAAYRELAAQWAQSNALEVALDSEYQQLPQDRPLWLFGRENRFAAQILEALGDQLEPSDPYAAIASPGQQPVGLVNANPQDLPALGRKLPHYGKYGKLRFASESMENTLKERGPRGESALTLNFELQEE